MPAKPLTQKEVRDVILAFWRLNASRAPIKDFEEIFDCENLEIRMRGTGILFRGIAGWADHQIGKLAFFDQRFQLKTFQVAKKTDERIVAKTVGVWFARHWQSPAAYSHEMIADLKHTWTVIRSPKTGKAVILTHVCDKLKYRPGHEPQADPKDFHFRIGK